MPNTPHEPNPCAFCGHADAAHRVRDAILDRFLAGESLDSLAWDYGPDGNLVETWLRQAMRERVERHGLRQEGY